MKRGMPRPAMLVALAVALVMISATGAAVAANAHAKGRWSVQTMPSPAGASNVALNGISCHTRKFCIAVGGSSLGTLAEEWNGTKWSVQTTPSPASGDALNSVSCVSVTACEAVGTGALAEAWNGTSWTVQPTPPINGASLVSVWCISRKACVAVGSSDKGPLGEGWNGTRWVRQRGFPPPQPPNRRPVLLSGVRCSSAQSCTGVGFGFLEPGPPLILVAAWNGKRWGGFLGANAGSLSGISCSETVCMAVGRTSSPIPRPHVPGPLSLINPGTVGTVVLPPFPKGASYGELNAVSCRSAVCEAVGDSSLGTLAERWNGTKWSLQSTPSPDAGAGLLAGIACTSATACIAVGTANGAPLAEAYSG